MRSVFVATFATVLLTTSWTTLRAQDLMVMEPRSAFIGFNVKLLGFYPIDGRFKRAVGSIVYNRADPTKSRVKIVIDTASVDSGFALRDDYMRSASVFDVANHPTMSFTSNNAVMTSTNAATLRGRLTIKGITRPVTLHVRHRTPLRQITSTGTAPPTASIEAWGRIKRRDFKLGSGVVVLTIRASFIACAGKAAARPLCRAAR